MIKAEGNIWYLMPNIFFASATSALSVFLRVIPHF